MTTRNITFSGQLLADVFLLFAVLLASAELMKVVRRRRASPDEAFTTRWGFPDEEIGHH
jgi:hypothetical protein